MKILIISLNFNPGHVSHLIASYKQCEDLGYALKGKNRRFDSVGARKIHFKEAKKCHFTNPRNLRSKISDFRRSCAVRRELGKQRLRVQRRSRF